MMKKISLLSIALLGLHSASFAVTPDPSAVPPVRRASSPASVQVVEPAQPVDVTPGVESATPAYSAQTVLQHMLETGRTQNPAHQQTLQSILEMDAQALHNIDSIVEVLGVLLPSHDAPMYAALRAKITTLPSQTLEPKHVMALMDFLGLGTEANASSVLALFPEAPLDFQVQLVNYYVQGIVPERSLEVTHERLLTLLEGLVPALTEASESKNPQAQYLLGVFNGLTAKGKVTETEKRAYQEKAFLLLESATEAGYFPAQCMLAAAYYDVYELKDMSQEQGLQKALELLEDAKKRGHLLADNYIEALGAEIEFRPIRKKDDGKSADSAGTPAA